MSAFDWFLIGWWLFGVLVLVTQIGKPKKPTTPEFAAVYIVIVGALIIGLLWSRGAL